MHLSGTNVYILNDMSVISPHTSLRSREYGSTILLRCCVKGGLFQRTSTVTVSKNETTLIISGRDDVCCFQPSPGKIKLSHRIGPSNSSTVLVPPLCGHGIYNLCCYVNYRGVWHKLGGYTLGKPKVSCRRPRHEGLIAQGN